MLKNWNRGILNQIERFDNGYGDINPGHPLCSQEFTRRLKGVQQNPFPFASVPAHLRPIAEARLKYYLEKAKAEGKVLTQQLIASRYGNAARYATQVHTGIYRRQRRYRRILTRARRALLREQAKEQLVTDIKSLPTYKRMKVLL